MQQLTFSNGDTMPMLGLGTWKSKPGEVYEAIKVALKAGYRHIDCAFIYGNEAEIGKAFQESFEEGILKREDLWVTSKLWNDAHQPKDVQAALEKTLSDLQLDYLDLYLIHWPVAHKSGVIRPEQPADFVSLKELPIAQTWQAMEALVDQGLTRHIGVSNFSTKKLQALLNEANIAPAMNQIELHPFLHQDEMLAFCKSKNIHLTAYSPLGSPDRPSSMKGENEPSLIENPVIREIATKHSIHPVLVLIAWAMQRGTAVIPKSVTPSHIEANLKAAEIQLDEEDLQKIKSLDKHRRYVDGSFWAMEGGPYTVKGLWDE